MRWMPSFLVLGLGVGLLGASDVSVASDVQQCVTAKPDEGQRYGICERLHGSLSFTPRDDARALHQLRRIAQWSGGALQQCEARALDRKLRKENCDRVQQDPAASPRDRARALLQFGRLVQWTSGGVAKAIDAYEKAIATDPSFMPAKVGRAEWLVLDNHGHEAIELLRPALEANPADMDALVMIGRAYANVQLYEQALRSFEQALKLEPNHVSALFELGKVLEIGGNYVQAAEVYEKAGARYDPMVEGEDGHGIENPYMAAARNHEYLGDFAKSLKLMNLIIARDPENVYDPRAFERRASYYEALGLNSEAIADITSALRATEPHQQSSLLLKRGALYLKDGKSTQANEDFRKAFDSGDRKTILRMQVYLRNQGFNEVKINGIAGPDLLKSIQECLATTKCSAGLGQPI